MALHLTPAEHDADPPIGWTVRKAGRRWQRGAPEGIALDTHIIQAIIAGINGYKST